MNDFVNPSTDRGAFIIIEGQPWGSAEFYGEWLLAAAAAEKCWKEIQKEPDFYRQFEPVCLVYMPDFGIAASITIKELFETFGSAALIDLETCEGFDFTMMFGMGFFWDLGQHYRMTVPSALTHDTVRKAIIKLINTDEGECTLHPEYLVRSMPLVRARAYQERMIAINDFQTRGSVLGNA
jgi:hypothetical protein